MDVHPTGNLGITPFAYPIPLKLHLRRLARAKLNSPITRRESRREWRRTSTCAASRSRPAFM